MLAVEPPPTRYDLHFTLAGTPVRVHPLFWLIALLLGSSSRSLVLIAIWVLIVFISILIHELGHATAMRASGLNPRIVLYSFGGLTTSAAPSWGPQTRSLREDVLIYLSGALAGFIFATIILLLIRLTGGYVGVQMLLGIIPLPRAALPGQPNIYLNFLISNLLWVNVGWGFINLLPVLPLDGGQISRIFFMNIDPRNGMNRSLWLSVGVAALIAVLGFVFLNSLYMALMFGYLAFSSYMMLQPGLDRRW
jgi:stage IV sporulation protein FB